MYDLIKELTKHKTFDENEENSKQTVLEFLKNNTNCYDRSNLKGHITAGALLVDGKGEVLLNHHLGNGMWLQFGGHSDADTDTLNVAKREVMEESGITDFEVISEGIFDVDVQVIPYSARKNEPEHFHYDVNFLFLAHNKNFVISNESSELMWLTIDEARKKLSPDDVSTKRMLLKYENLLKSQGII
ncbi:MAG: NUDIX domain-containing protein [Clostridia bacterium]|nr:NUDIX domain-containing protein [Clostridia bacterium]